MAEVAAKLNEIVQLMYDLRYTGRTEDPEVQLKIIADKLMSVLRYDRVAVRRLVISGCYNKYIKEDITINMYGRYGEIQNHITRHNILEVIKSSRPVESDYFEQLLTQLNVMGSQYDWNAGYAKILDQLKTFLTHFVDLHSRSKSVLLSFLNKNFNHELKQLSNIKLQLEEKDLFLNDNLIKQITSLVGESIYPTSSLGSNAVYGFQNIPSFEANDQSFKNLFYMFLQIVGDKINPGSDDVDFSKAINLMLNTFMQRSGILWYELSDYSTLELKVNALYEFLATDDDVIKHACTNLFQTDNFYPEMLLSSTTNTSAEIKLDVSESNTDHTIEFRLPESTPRGVGSFIMPENDQIQLIVNIQRLLPQLNDFNFNFDEHFDLSMQKFLIMINSDLSSDDDASFLNDIIHLINTIVDFENDETANNGGNIYQTALHLYELHKLLSPDYIGSNSKATLLMRLCAIEVKRSMIIKDRVLKAWNRRILQISRLNHSLHSTWQKYTKLRVTSVIFNIWREDSLTNYSKELAAADYYNKTLLVQMLLSKWVPKFHLVRLLGKKAELAHSKKLFTKWMERKGSIQILQNLAIQTDTRYVTQKYFTLLRHRTQYLQKLHNQSLEFRNFHSSKLNDLILRMTFVNWYEKLNSVVGIELLVEKLQKLTIMERQVILKTFFQRMKKSFDLKAKEQQVIRINNESLARYLFNKWEHLYKLKHIAESFGFQRDNRHKENLFMHWRLLTDKQSIAKQYNKKRLLRTALNAWKLELLSKRFVSKEILSKNDGVCHDEFIYTQLSVSFRKWRLAIKSKELKQFHRSTQAKIFFNQWIHKLQHIQHMKQLSLAANSSGCSRKYLLTWYNVYQFQNHLPEVANSFYLKTYWFRLKAKYEKQNRLFEIESNYENSSKYKLSDKIILHSMIRLWKFKRDDIFQSISDAKISHFRGLIVKQNLQQRYFIAWVNAYNNSTFKEAELQELFEAFNKKSLFKQFFFNKWQNRTTKITLLKEKCQDFEYTLLHKKYMVIWYDKFLNKTQYLDELAQELIDQRELRIQREMLSEWSMKYIKFITSSQQSCDLFVKRWESSRVKSIFDLWFYKLESRKLEDIIKTEERDDFIQRDSKNVFLDTSTDSVFNESPLALKKRATSKSAEAERTDPVVESYLTSPIKSNTKIPATPVANNTKNISPTRLQTSLRMKNERIQAVRDRFRKAKGAKSVPTTSRKSTTATTIKPYSFIHSDVNISPPKRPEFHSTPKKSSNSQGILFNEDEFLTNTEPPFSPNYASKVHSSSISTFHDIPSRPSSITYRKEANSKDIEDAKKLKKITPIIIPMSEDEEPRISPIKTIKQRNSVIN